MTENQPAAWTDTKGRTWHVSLNFGLVLRLRDELQVDLLNESNPVAFATLLTERDRLGHALWMIHEKQAASRSVTREDFYAAIDSDCLAAGWGALEVAYINFCQFANRESVRAQLARTIEAVERVARWMVDRDPVYQAEIEQAAAETIGEMAG